MKITYNMYYIRHCSNWWLAMIAFGFLPENFDRWRGPTNTTSLFYESRFSGGNTHRWIRHSNSTWCHQICLNFLQSQVVGMLKYSSYALSRLDVGICFCVNVTVKLTLTQSPDPFPAFVFASPLMQC